MTRLRRLLDSDLNGLELELLRSADDDRPPEKAMLDAAAALGVGALVMGAASAASTATASSALLGTGAIEVGRAAALGAAPELAALGAGAAAPAAGASIGGSALSASALLKPLAIGVLAGVATTSGVELVSTFNAPRAEPAPIVRQAPARAPEAAEPRARVRAPSADRAETPAPVPAESTKAALDPAATVAPKHAKAELVRAPAVAPAAADTAAPPSHVPTASFAPAESPAPASAPPPADRSLVIETALLDRARGALLAGDAQGTLRVLDEYAGTSHRGILQPDALVLRVRALLALGDRPRAAAAARRFVNLYPESRHAESLRPLADEGRR